MSLRIAYRRVLQIIHRGQSTKTLCSPECGESENASWPCCYQSRMETYSLQMTVCVRGGPCDVFHSRRCCNGKIPPRDSTTLFKIANVFVLNHILSNQVRRSAAEALGHFPSDPAGEIDAAGPRVT